MTPDQLTALSEHLNAEHPDSVLVVARWLGGHPEAASAEVSHLDENGVEIVVDAGARSTRVPFQTPVFDLATARASLLGLVAEARRQGRIDEPTSAERPAADPGGVRTWITTVTKVGRLTPRLAQVTCGGGDLADFQPIGPDQFVYVLAPQRGKRLGIDRSFSWETHEAIPDGDRPVGAYYTVRRFRPERAEIDLMVVLHGGEGEGSRWATRAAPGDEVALWGPRHVFRPPTGTEHLFLVGDETAIPALGAIIEWAPPSLRVDVICELGHAEDRLLPVAGPNVEVEWLTRRGEAGTGSGLIDAIRQRNVSPERTYAWGGGESRIMTTVRKHLRHEVGMEHRQVGMTPYWRRTA